MSGIAEVLVVNKLVHDQLTNSWINRKKIKRAVIIDDDVARKGFLHDVFRIFIPPEIDLEILSCDKTGRAWRENDFDRASPTLVLFQNINSAFQAYRSGFEFKWIVVSTTEHGEKKRLIDSNIELSDSEILQLESLSRRGVDVRFQHGCESRVVNWKGVKKRILMPEGKLPYL